MPEIVRPFPPARDFDLSQSKRVKSDFHLNEEIPSPFRSLVNFLNEQPGWIMDVGRTMVVLYEQTDKVDHRTAIRLSWFGEEQRVSLDFIPRRTETRDFARRTIGEEVQGQSRMYRVTETDFGSDPRPFVSFGTFKDSPAGMEILEVALDLKTGSVDIGNRYAAEKQRED